jgi:uncharacterized membrane protein (UPF0127 family)
MSSESQFTGYSAREGLLWMNSFTIVVHISFIKSAGSVAAAKEKTKGNKEK